MIGMNEALMLAKREDILDEIASVSYTHLRAHET